MGSCGLHVIHGAFQTGHKASGWNVNGYLRAMYRLFKDSPAQRAVYTEVTGSKTFPKKFCTVRWIENVAVAERALELLPNVNKFADSAMKSKTSCATITSATVKTLSRDKLAAAKISFFASVAAQCEPFLKKYQTQAPLAPYLYDEIGQLLRTLMKRVVKKSILEKAESVSQLVKIDVTKKDTRCNYKEVDVGVAATKSLTEVKLSDAERMGFRMECLEFLSSMVAKIIERSPLKYAVTRAISCLVPSTVCSVRVLAEKRMKNLAQIMYDKGNITAVTADKCKSQFSDLYQKASGNLHTKFSSFSSRCDRLDAFYYDIIGQDIEFVELFSVVCLVLTLSRGNASVESGFSVNSDMLVENLHEDSLVAQRTVYDAVQAEGGVTSVNIDKPLLMYVRGSHARYQAALECKRKATSELDQKTAAKKKACEQIKVLQTKKAKFMEEAATESRKVDMEIAELQKLKK